MITNNDQRPAGMFIQLQYNVSKDYRDRVQQSYTEDKNGKKIW